MKEPPRLRKQTGGMTDFQGVDMDKRICSVPDCAKPHLAQGRCSNHYQIARRAGEIAVLPPKPRHDISNVNHERRTGDCQICGPVEVFLSEGKPPRCAVKVREIGKRKRDRQKDPDRWEAVLGYHRHYARRRKFRLPKDGIERLIQQVGQQCEICSVGLTIETARIDHDHACCNTPGRPTCGLCIRGILCNACNAGIGMMKDDPVRLAAAAKYLNERTGIPFGQLG